MPQLRRPSTSSPEVPDTVQPLILKVETDQYDTTALTAKEIEAFKAAVSRRTGPKGWEDWQIVMRTFRRASDMALELSGQTSRQNPVYKKHFSRIISILPPISSSEKTSEQYRAALLTISYEGDKFNAWREEANPQFANPIDMLHAYRKATEPKPTGDPPPTPQHVVELARAHEDAAKKIAELTDEVERLQGTDDLNIVLERAATWPDEKICRAIEALHQLLTNRRNQSNGHAA
jgi:hypothetical protein